MKKRLSLLLCLSWILLLPINALAAHSTGDRAALFNPNRKGYYGVIRMEDGSLRAVGDQEFSETRGWKDLRYLSYNQLCAVGLTREGKVLLGRKDGLVKGYRITDALKWKNIVSLQWYSIYLYGIDDQGVLHVTGGDDANRKLMAHHKADGWKNIQQVVPLSNALFALQTDGTIRLLEPRTHDFSAAEEWTDIVQIAGTDHTLFGLRSDGTVLQCGWFEYASVRDWTDIKRLVTDGMPLIAGIKNDGSVVGDDSYNRVTGAEDWKNVRKLITDARAMYAISEEGALLTTKAGAYSEEWHDLMDIWLEGGNIAGLRSDGAVLIHNTLLESRETP